ncbi:MAG: BatD family protein [Kiritimatiellales bacterium]
MLLKSYDCRLLVLISALALNAFCFDAVMKIQPPVIGLNEQAQLTIEVRQANNAQPPAIPDVPGLKINFSGQQTHMNWINGKSDNFVSFNYTVYPQQTGAFQIGPFEYKTGRESKMLQGEIRVVSNAGSAQQSESWSDYLFARISVDRATAYIQEPYELTLEIYTRPEIQLTGNINLAGDHIAGLAWQQAGETREVFHNTVFNVRRFRAGTRAISSGTIQYAPVITVQVAVQNQNRRQNRDPFAGFFSDPFFHGTETRPVDIPAEPAVIEIKPLPADRPDGFTGGVGQFVFQTDAQPREVHPGDPVTLTMKITGRGNFDRITAPALPAEAPFRMYGEPSKKQDETGVLFEQVISPRDANVTEIPALTFSFFDTQTGEYTVLHSAPIPLTVNASENSTAQLFATKEIIIQPAPDTPFATESDLQKIEAFVTKLWNTVRPWLWTLPAAAGLWLILFVARKIYFHRKKDIARARRQKAPKAARRALRAADYARRRNDSKAFYDSLWNALADYFGNRLNLPPGDVTADIVLRSLEQENFSAESVAELRIIFDRVEISRYGIDAAKTPEEMKAVQRSLEQILKHCEKRL